MVGQKSNSRRSCVEMINRENEVEFIHLTSMYFSLIKLVGWADQEVQVAKTL